MATGWLGVVELSTTKLGYNPERPWVFECSQDNCFWRIACPTKEQAELELINHSCPYWGGVTKVSWPVTKTLVQQLWDLLDECMIKLKSTQIAPEEQDAEKIRARAFAESLAIFMPPFFKTSDEIAAEAGRRYKAIQSGEEYETAGLNARNHETPEKWIKAHGGGFSTTPEYQVKPDEKPRGQFSAPVKTPETKLSDKEIAAIKFGKESGMFSLEELARSYKVSVDVISSIVGK